jgi:hypothetical protein
MEASAARRPALDAALVVVALTDADAGTRSQALAALRLHEADGATVDAISSPLARDPDASWRQAAAEALGDVSPACREKTLAMLASALDLEREPFVRRTELTSIVRAGRAQAIPTLEAIQRKHADLAQDAEDYLVELRKGEVDMDHLWAAKERAESLRRDAGAGPDGSPGGSR